MPVQCWLQCPGILQCQGPFLVTMHDVSKQHALHMARKSIMCPHLLGTGRVEGDTLCSTRRPSS